MDSARTPAGKSPSRSPATSAGSGLGLFLLLRLGRLALTLAVVVLTVFILVRVIPGDPAQVIVGTHGSAEDLANLRHQLGIDRPLWEQFGVWVADLGTLNLGRSMVSGEPVLDLLVARFPLTLELSALALGLALVVGIPLGVVSALRKDTWVDHLGLLVSQLGLALPGFWLGILLLLAFAVALPIFPLFGSGTLWHLVLPSTALGAGMAAVLVRHVRSSVIEELGKEYVTAARASGYPTGQIVKNHVLRNSLVPVLTIAGIQFGSILGGAVVIEQVFSLPGLGRLLLTAVVQRDLPLVQGGIVFVAFVVCLVNFAVDLLYLSVNPKMRTR